MDRNLALEFVRVTEAAAIAAAEWIGYGEAKKADGAAVDAMRSRFNQIDFAGTVVIGEGQKDEAPELYVGETIGTGAGPAMEIAVDPLECTDSVAHGRYNAMAVIVAGPVGSLFRAPDTYMNKIAVGPEAAGVIDLDATPTENVLKVAQKLGKDTREITVMVLDRPRHTSLVEELRAAGARVRMVSDGDVATAVATCMPEHDIDMVMGIGGSTEAVLAAAPVKIMGGQLLARFTPPNDKHAAVIANAGYDTKKIYTAEDLAHGRQLTFTATGIIDGPLLRGVITRQRFIETHSLVLRGSSGTARYISTHHDAYKASS
ncbi:MAG: class II fructose-bisphosphatase [Candidatus Kerfeldbacteria bacterium]|nr:class II fructose-bisphosphatase [Candidatus Kerfeldbacteria bacterium]